MINYLYILCFSRLVQEVALGKLFSTQVTNKQNVISKLTLIPLRPDYFIRNCSSRLIESFGVVNEGSQLRIMYEQSKHMDEIPIWKSVARSYVSMESYDNSFEFQLNTY